MSSVLIQEQLASLQELRASAASLDPETATARLLPFLRHANNLIVAKAAELARDLELRSLLEEVVSAFRRFLEAPARKDPQCWAKNALSKAMHQLGSDDAPLFLAGLRLHQYEPVWGGQSDVAGTLRANCAYALVECRQLTHHALLLHLLEIVADADKSVRGEAMRAIAAAGGDSAILLLRTLAIKGGKEEPEVLGHCYAGLLALEGSAAIPFVAQFLAAHDDRSAEAAVALGETRTPEGLTALLQCLHPAKKEEDGTRTTARRFMRSDALLEPTFAAVLLSAIALTRQAEAIEVLLKLISEESILAEAAIEALAAAGYGEDVRKRLFPIVERLHSDRLTRCLKSNFPVP